MKIIILALIMALLPACTPVETKKAKGIPPLTSIIPLIRQGMGLTEVNQALSGHKPYLQFTYHDKTIWEFIERTEIPKDHSMHANELSIVFDHQGKVQESTSSFCFLPDQEPLMAGNTPTTSCYQKHLFPFDKQVTYDAIKRLLIISNYQVDHSDAASEIISATGIHGIEGNKDKMMFIKLSIIFSTKAESTEVVMSATFSMSEKRSTLVSVGFAGVILPVPLPFQKTEEWVDAGIVTPRFYLGFYDALSKLIASEYLPYKPVNLTLPSIPLKTPSIPVLQQHRGVETYPPQNDAAIAIDEELAGLKGPIDSIQKPKKNTPSKAKIIENDMPEENDQNNDFFSTLKGRPIDSKKRME